MTRPADQNHHGDDWQCPWAVEIPGYLLGESQEKENRALKKHLDECSYCREDLWEMQVTMEKIQAPAVMLQKDLAPKILANIPQENWKSGQTFSKPFRKIGSLMAASILALVCLYNFWDQPHNRTDPNITKALQWLAQNQELDGAWHPQKWGGQREYTTALTGLVLLAFLENDCAGDRFQINISRALQYILRRQNSDGLFGPATNHALYNQGIATLALLKAHAQKKDLKKLARPIERALRYIYYQQSASGVCGNLYFAQKANISVAFWQLQALLTAQSQGQFHLGKNVNMELTSMDEVIQRMTAPPAAQLDYYQWYFLSWALHKAHIKDPHWTDKVRKILLERQIKTGVHQGSWEPNDHWGQTGGRLYSTAMAVLTLQVL